MRIVLGEDRLHARKDVCFFVTRRDDHCDPWHHSGRRMSGNAHQTEMNARQERSVKDRQAREDKEKYFYGIHDEFGEGRRRKTTRPAIAGVTVLTANIMSDTDSASFAGTPTRPKKYMCVASRIPRSPRKKGNTLRTAMPDQKPFHASTIPTVVTDLNSVYSCTANTISVAPVNSPARTIAFVGTAISDPMTRSIMPRMPVGTIRSRNSVALRNR